MGSKLDQEQIIKQVYDEPNNRLRVDATVSASIGDVSIVDSDGNELDVNPDGSINTNITGNLDLEISAADGDNIAISDGTNTAVVTPAGALSVDQQNLTFIDDKVDVSGSSVTVTATNLDIRDLNSATDSVTVVASDLDIRDLNSATDSVTVAANDLDIRDLDFTTDSVDVTGSDVNVVNQVDIRPLNSATDSITIGGTVSLDEPVKISGTNNGLVSGTEYGFVYNRRSQVLDSDDRVENYTYVDFGTKNQRITRIDYTSATFPGITVRRDFNYVLDSGSYRRTTSVWSIV